jgi:deoxyribodipyrimidine photo-lyase
MTKKRALVWFRQDLRLEDNEALVEAIKHADEVICAYVFDERIFKGTTTWFDFPKTGKFRAKFIIESVQNLKDNLKTLNVDLLIRVGKTEDELAKIVQEMKCSWVFCNRERTYEEVLMQDSLEKKLWSQGQEMIYTRGKMLYYTQDLPFPVHYTPDTFTQFRKEVEKSIPIRKPLPKPTQIKTAILEIPIGKMPTLKDFGHSEIEEDKRSAIDDLKGGESAGKARLQYYLWESNLVKNYKETRNELIGTDFSSKLSIYLAQGCLSPKTIYAELKKYEQARGSNESTYWLFFELLWRDFFRLMGKKYNNRIFFKDGPMGSIDKRWRNDERLLKIWIEGRTGIPFIDANMRELAATGFMSNRGRQNVASFLVKDLFVNWQMGAEYFESILIDYDPCSNWGNWNYVAGVGADPRENRYFNIIRQAKMYDPKGCFVKLWLPELAAVPVEKVHQPELLSFEEQGKYGVKLGAHYPKPMIKFKTNV